LEPIHMTWVLVGFRRSRLLPSHASTSVRQREKKSAVLNTYILQLFESSKL